MNYRSLQATAKFGSSSPQILTNLAATLIKQAATLPQPSLKLAATFCLLGICGTATLSKNYRNYIVPLNIDLVLLGRKCRYDFLTSVCMSSSTWCTSLVYMLVVWSCIWQFFKSLNTYKIIDKITTTKFLTIIFIYIWSNIEV